MSTTHHVIVANGKDDMEIKLDNGANKGWSIVWIIESQHVPEQFWIVFSKEYADDE